MFLWSNLSGNANVQMDESIISILVLLMIKTKEGMGYDLSMEKQFSADLAEPICRSGIVT